MAEVEIPEYPSNSYKQKDISSKQRSKTSKSKASEIDDNYNDEKNHEKRVQAVGKAKAQKKSLVQKLAKSIIEDSIESVKERAFNDIIVPGLKSLIFDTITDMADAMLFGNSEYSNGYSSRNRSSSRRQEDRASYSGYYDKKSRRNRRDNDRRSSWSDYSMEPDDIKVKTRRIANNALAEVDKCIRKYGQASIADLYDAVELTSDWTDSQYGWTDIRGAKIRPIRDGFMIIMPPTIELD